MEPLSMFTSVLNAIKGAFSWVLKLFGKKIVDINEYQDITVKVQFDYAVKSPQCIHEKENGAEFFWSEYDMLDVERYFEINGNTRKFFQNDSKQYLLIKRVKK